MFFWREQTGPVEWGITDRADGVSQQPFGTLNLGGHVGDDPEAVEQNRHRLADSLGRDRHELVFMNQCHGADVAVVDGPWERGAGAPAVDGIVTTTPGLALAVLVADCTPVLLADPVAGVIGAVHAGRPGMTTGIIDRAVATMREAGAREITAVVGPSVCGRCYEVPEEMSLAAAEVSPEARAVSWSGTPAIDVAAGVVAQLRANSVAVQWVPGCTRESDRLYSYRRDRQTGRFAGVVQLAQA
ncbi:MAG TPA: peptidoglycan editing factor PgeF [Pedococcus sp.]|uniref:peptidoglycan editing factor PgeF n=1 Tax=Pedococcus sp. TaxID=2860345 RepID=UPI002F95A264